MCYSLIKRVALYTLKKYKDVLQLDKKSSTVHFEKNNYMYMYKKYKASCTIINK